MGSRAACLKMTMDKSILLFSLFATVPALPPPQPTTTTEASVKTRTNGLINDVKEINLFLNIPTGCDIVYDGLIKQLEGCRSGSNHGDPRLTSRCLLKLDFTHLQQDCANTALFFPVVKSDPTPPRGSLQRHLLPDEWKADIQRGCRNERGVPSGGGRAGSQATSQHWGPARRKADLWLRL